MSIRDLFAAQVPVTAEWSKWIVVQLAVTWQVSQAALVAMWVAGLPVAVVPLWQVAQAPVTWEWSKVITFQAVVLLWQVSQAPVVAMCVAEYEKMCVCTHCRPRDASTHSR